MATNAIHKLKLGSTEYPIYSEGFKIDTLGSLSEGDFYPILLSDKWTRAQETPTAADDSKALVTKTVGHLSWLPSSRTLYTKNLCIGGIPGSGNPGGTLYISGYVKAATEDGTSVSLGESNQVLASGGGDNNVHWRTIDLVGGKDTIGLVKNGSSVNPDGDTWKPVAFKDGVPYYQEVKVDISNMPELDAVLDDLRNSIFSEGPGISIYEEQGQTAKKVGLKLATANERGGIRIGYSQNDNNYPVRLGGENNDQAYVTVPTPYIPIVNPFTVGNGTHSLEIHVDNPVRTYSVDFEGGDNVTIDWQCPSSPTLTAATLTINATDEKVTSESKHYSPTENSDSTLSAAGGNTIDITNNPTSIVTGIKRDSKGHVVGLETTQLKSTAAEITVDNLDMSAYLKKDEAENTYLSKNGGTVNGTLNIVNDGITIVSNSTIESAGFSASDFVKIDGTNITGESPNTFFIGYGNNVIFGVDGNGVTTTEVNAATIHVNKIVLPDGEITSSDTSDFVTKSTEQEISGKKTFTDTITGKDIDLSREGETQFFLSDTQGVMMGDSNNSIKYHHLIGRNDNDARASFAGGAAVFKYEDKSSHLKTVYVDNLLQTPILQSETGMIQSVPSSSKFTFNTGDTNPLEINAASATFSVPVMSSMGLFDTSDERKKNFIRPIDVDLEKLSTLKKYYFTWKDGNGEMQIGTSAQEVKELYPELVNEAEDGTLSVAYNKLSVVALAAIDKLHDENNELKKKVSTLEERLERIESLLEEKLNNL